MVLTRTPSIIFYISSAAPPTPPHPTPPTPIHPPPPPASRSRAPAPASLLGGGPDPLPAGGRGERRRPPRPLDPARRPRLPVLCRLYSSVVRPAVLPILISCTALLYS